MLPFRAPTCSRHPAPPAASRGGAVVAATTPHQPMEIPMPKLTDTQLIILSTASQRDDRGVELPANLKGGAARKAVDKLIRAAR